MERDWLAAELEAGRSIESIAREAGRNPSTVAYWVNSYGLTSQHTSKHRARGGIRRELLTQLVQEGLSVREIAASQALSATTVRHWLRKFGLKTQRAEQRHVGDGCPPELVRECKRHGWTFWVRSGSGDRYRCKQCRLEAVSTRRRRVKEILVDEAGGECLLCGYDRYAGALQFHHVDPAQKAFALSSRGLARSIEKARVEVAKCVLLCGNCHAEVEAGLATIPRESPP